MREPRGLASVAVPMTDSDPEIVVPPEALAPSGRSEDSLPETAPNPATRDPQEDPEDGATEIAPTPSA